jgi:hypothetical protein
VEGVVNRLLLKPDRTPLPAELADFWPQVEAIDICHYAFPANLNRLIEGIGRLEPVPGFVGCGSFGDAQRRLAEESVHSLSAWLRREPSGLQGRLGQRTLLKEWLVTSLAKTLKELVGLPDILALPATER